MGRLEELRKFKKKWGYDDFHVGTDGRMEEFGVTGDLRDRVVRTLFELAPERAAEFRAKFENPEAVNLDGLKGLLEVTQGDQGALIKEVGEAADRIRYTTGSPTPELIRRIADALGGDHPKADALAEWQRDLTTPYDPMQTALAVSILNRVRDRGTVDRTAAIDQVAGKIYSTDRRAELVALTNDATGGEGHYIAEAYGLRTIKDMTDTSAMSGIRNVHDESSVYQRDSLKSDLNTKLKKVYNDSKSGTGRGKVTLREGGDLPKYSGAKMFFVNSPDVDTRLDKIYTGEWVDPETSTLKFKQFFTEIVTLDQNIHVILMTKGSASDKDLQTFKKHLLEGSGSSPSAYAIERAESPSKAVDLLSHASMLDDTASPNDTALDRVAKSKGAARLSSLPDDHPMQQTALASAKMVSGLQKALAGLGEPKAGQYKQNTLVKSALDKIERLMQVMPTYAEDSPRFSKLFDLLVDEVYLVLATCKPYKIESYHETTAKVTEERIPILARKEELPKAQHKTFMVSTGMGAMSAAVEAAYARTGSRKLHLVDSNKENSHSANYFEVEGHLIGESVTDDMLDESAIVEEGYTPPVIMATLNPSTPTNPETDVAKTGWTINELTKNVRAVLTKHDERLKADSCTSPAVLVIDATVERDGAGEDQEMNKVVAFFAEDVNAARLEIIFIKSYQKYPSLGAGKAMAGGLTVIGNTPDEGEPFAGEPWATAQRSEGDENIMANDEAQIVTHFLTHESDVERKMLARAAKNASFVRGFLPASAALPKDSPMAYDDGLPFLAVPNSNIAVGSAGQGDRLLDELLINQGVEPRMSFGFQNTSGLPTSPGMMRIGVGQESEAELVEKLYATLTLATTGASADHTKHDKDKPDYLPEGTATAKSVVAVAKAAADKGFSQVADGLAMTRDPLAARDDPANIAWREKTVAALIRAKVLTPGKVTWTKGRVQAPDDDVLAGLMTEIGSADAATPEGLRKKLAVVTSLRKVDIKIESLKLSRQAFPSSRVPEEGKARDAWRETMREFLGADAPDVEAGDDVYLKALEDAKGPWRERTKAVLGGQELPLPVLPTPPEGISEREIKAYRKAMSDYDTELRLALSELDDATRMHSAVAVGFDLPEGTEIGVEATYLANIVASCASTQLAAMKDEAAFCELFDVLREVGLDQLSNEARERLMDRRGNIALETLKGGAFEGKLKDLGRIAKSFPYGEGPGRLLIGSVLDKLIEKPAEEDAPFTPEQIKGIAEALLSGMTLPEMADALPRLVREAAKIEIKAAKKVKPQAAGTLEQKALAQAVAVHLKARLTEAENRQKRDPTQAPVRTPHLFADDETPERAGLEPMTVEELSALKDAVRQNIETALAFDVLPK